LERFYSSSAFTVPKRPVTAPLGGQIFKWGDIVECSEFGGTFSLGIVTLVTPNDNVSRKYSLEVFQASGRFRRVDSNFIRFAVPLLEKAPEDGLNKLEVSMRLKKFEAEARKSLLEHFHLFEAAVERQILSAGHVPLASTKLLYEGDISRIVFGADPTATDLYAVHLYLHSYCEKFGRDNQYLPGPFGSGPYYVKSSHDRILIDTLTKLIASKSPIISQFQKEAKLCLTTSGKARMIPDFDPLIKCLEKAVLCSWLDSTSNPFIELCKQIFEGIAPCDTANDFVSLFRRLGLEDRLLDVDIPKMQSGLEFLKARSSFEQMKSLRSPQLGEDCSAFDGRVQFDTPALAIDADTTIEVDDAVSIQRIGSKIWLHVHIADPSRLIPLDSVADLEARSLSSTVYLAQSNYTMLPLNLGMQASLDPKKAYNGCLTLSAQLGSNGDIADYQVNFGVLTRLERVNYEQADAMLSTTETSNGVMTLKDIQALTDNHRNYRTNQGAVHFEIPHSKISFERHGDVSSLECKIEESVRPSAALVSECMIIAGRISALFAKERNITIPFRYHADPTIEGGIECRRLLDKVMAMGSNASFYDKLHLLSYFQASAVDIQPRKHWAMGLDMYAKVTSPLRRYFDLLLHHQLGLFLSKSVPKTADQIAGILSPIYRHEQYLRRLQFASQRYWTIRYIAKQLKELQNCRGEWTPLEVTVIPLAYNTSSSVTIVYITDYAIRSYCQIPGGSTLNVGEPVKLYIVSVDPIRQTIQLVLSK
jgi:exoribonuclease-2